MFIYIAIALIQVILFSNSIRIFMIDHYALRYSQDHNTEITDAEMWWMTASRIVSGIAQILLLLFSSLAIIEAFIK